jgi:CheY-like chemotaxis protein
MPTILLADDEAPLRMVLYRFLKARGYEVLAAADGAEALRISQEYPGTLDLLIADIQMPGMEGRELARRLKEARPGLKTIFISGYAAGISVQEPFLLKPFPFAVLLKTIRELTDSS